MHFQESETVELKSVIVDDIKKEIIAFANCEGGKLYIGVQDDGTVVGLDDPDGAALQISNMVRDAVKPDLTMFLHYETLNEDGLSPSTYSGEPNAPITLPGRACARKGFLSVRDIRPCRHLIRQSGA